MNGEEIKSWKEKWTEEEALCQSFNSKWAEYLSEGHYGMAIADKDVIDYLNTVFEQKLKNLPKFSYQQIKLKFGKARFYFSADISFEEMRILTEGIEREIDKILDKD